MEGSHITVKDLFYVQHPVTRFIQATKFLRSLKDTEILAAAIRNQALLKSLEGVGSYQELADYIDTTRQHIHIMKHRAEKRFYRDYNLTHVKDKDIDPTKKDYRSPIDL